MANDEKKFVRTTAINKIGRLTKRIKGIQGGTSAGKTFGILPLEINYCTKHPFTETSVVSESVPHLKRGAIKDFKAIMQITKRWNAKSWNSTDSKYTFSNGSFIEFFSADSDSKLRGARRDRLYINECNNISFEAYGELAMRTKGSITLDWNPTAPFWFHEHLQGDKDVDFLIINYLDNEACPQSAIDEIEKNREKAKTSAYFDNWYKVYGLGQMGSLDGVVFENWRIVKKIPEHAELIGYGLDFGYSGDPAACVSIWYADGKRYVKQEFYKKRMQNYHIFEYFVKIKYTGEKIWADSSEPKSIDQLKELGLNIEGVVKGKDSINHGINTMQEVDEYLITECSLDLIAELRAYRYMKDSAGNSKIVGKDDHAIDAFRYHEHMTIGGQQKKYGISAKATIY